MQIYGKFSKNLYLGVSKFNFSLGLLFIFFYCCWKLFGGFAPPAAWQTSAVFFIVLS